jgi:hypothetical protein
MDSCSTPRRPMTPAVHRVPYRETVHNAELAPGLDLAGFNKLADELEDETIRPGAAVTIPDVNLLNWRNPLTA